MTWCYNIKMNEQQYFIYIMTNKPNGTLYIGFTSNLIKRVWEHKNNFYSNSFTAKYNLHNLVYYEIYSDVNIAINREKQLKNCSRVKKLKLIHEFNPNYDDLYNKITSCHCEGVKRLSQST